MKDYQLFGMGIIIMFMLFILVIVYSTIKTIEVYDLEKVNKLLLLEVVKQKERLYIPQYSF